MLLDPGKTCWNPASSASFHHPCDRCILHPDFIFIRDIDGELVVDIIDPHLDHGDSRDKWKGLAWYASEHSDVIRRAIAVIRIGETDWGLDLAKPSVREALNNTDEPLEDLFQRLGSKRIQG